MKKLFVLLLLPVLLFACSKDQRSVNKLEGTWLATTLEVVSDGEVVVSVDDEYTTVLHATFGDCKLSKNKGCETSWVISSPSNTNYAYDYTVSDDGSVLEMTSWSSPTYSDRTYQILELDKDNMTLRSGNSQDYYTYTFVKQ
ncbi:MAG: hypothetical protein GQ574_04915 [Crocinitomix sp.]|nr:hypothetical protein [Crocinitomix sp.]